jgi:hypothetical protein
LLLGIPVFVFRKINKLKPDLVTISWRLDSLRAPTAIDFETYFPAALEQVIFRQSLSRSYLSPIGSGPAIRSQMR